MRAPIDHHPLTAFNGLRCALSGLVDLLLPLRCAGCGAAGTGWCPSCARELGGPRRVRGELPSTPPGAAPGPAPPVFALGKYRAAARRAVLAYKVSGRRDLAEPFGRALAAGVTGLIRWDERLDPGTPAGERPLRAPAAAAGSADVARPAAPDWRSTTWHLVPAPSRTMSSRRRGGAHMARVAHRAADELAEHGLLAAVTDCLEVRGARDSVGLDPEQRLRNLAGRVSVRGRTPPPGEPVLLVDDVLTSGATIASCAAALAAAGAPSTAAIVLTNATG